MAVNVKVVARRDQDGKLEDCESLLRRFKKEVLRSYVLEDVKKHEYYMSAKEYREFKHNMLMRHIKNKKYR